MLNALFFVSRMISMNLKAVQSGLHEHLKVLIWTLHRTIRIYITIYCDRACTEILSPIRSALMMLVV